MVPVVGVTVSHGKLVSDTLNPSGEPVLPTEIVCGAGALPESWKLNVSDVGEGASVAEETTLSVTGITTALAPPLGVNVTVAL